MATASDYLFSKERRKIRAERSCNEEVRQGWLNLAESYAALLALEKIEIRGTLISGKCFEAALVGPPLSHRDR
jgi:hypothetical protein